jgi:Family of unknown function (DUF5678)
MGADSYTQAEERFGAILAQYAGQWVAVEDHSVVAYDPELKNVLGQLNGKRETAVVFRVEPDPAPVYVQ